jgi:D-alanyl-lipoteichoic acid acyltransferase DltB (MBOAT superfamily)
MLRLISFNMDYYWAYNSRGGEVSAHVPYLSLYLCTSKNLSSTSTEKQRANTPLPLEDYTYRNYITYVLYPPLYIAGPIMTFNNFMWQVHDNSLPFRSLSFILFYVVALPYKYLHTPPKPLLGSFPC